MSKAANAEGLSLDAIKDAVLMWVDDCKPDRKELVKLSAFLDRLIPDETVNHNADALFFKKALRHARRFSEPLPAIKNLLVGENRERALRVIIEEAGNMIVNHRYYVSSKKE